MPTGDARDPPAEESNRDGQRGDAPSVAERNVGDCRQTPAILAENLRHGLEDLVADMSIRTMKSRLQELGANPRRLASCLEKVQVPVSNRCKFLRFSYDGGVTLLFPSRH